jgi:hypothetical protein
VCLQIYNVALTCRAFVGDEVVLGRGSGAGRSKLPLSKHGQQISKADDVAFALFGLDVSAHEGEEDIARSFGVSRGEEGLNHCLDVWMEGWHRMSGIRPNATSEGGTVVGPQE